MVGTRARGEREGARVVVREFMDCVCVVFGVCGVVFVSGEG